MLMAKVRYAIGSILAGGCEEANRVKALIKSELEGFMEVLPTYYI